MSSIVAYENRQASRPLRMGLGALEDPEQLGRVLASSGYFQDARDAAQAVVKVLAGQELGFGPIASMTGVYIVKGRVTLSANLIAAAIKRHPGYDFRVRTLTNDGCEVVFLERGRSCVDCKGVGETNGVLCRECMGTGRFAIGSSEFTMADARTAQLAGGENWKKYPRAMLFARAISAGAKWHCPEVFAGAPVYTPDELGADIDAETGEILNPEAFEPVRPAPAPTPAAPKRAKATPKPAPEPEPVPVVDVTVTTEPVEPMTVVDMTVTTEPLPEPEPTPAATSEMGDDPDAKLTDEQAATVVDRLHTWGTPEAMWRMALMTWDAERVADLTVGQARELMKRARDRYGAADSKV